MSEREQDLIDDEVLCLVTVGRLSKDAAQSEHCEAAIAFQGNIEAEPRTEHTTTTTILDVEKEPETLNPFTLEVFLQTQGDGTFCRKRSKSVGDLQSCFAYD